MSRLSIVVAGTRPNRRGPAIGEDGVLNLTAPPPGSSYPGQSHAAVS
jgi:hypothetical protein